jgi:UDP-perosamine 4-acetyltransferase
MSNEPERVIILGSGGHGRVAIDIIDGDNRYIIVGVSDASGPQKASSGNRFGVLGDDSILPHIYQSGVQHAFVAIGDNRLRQVLSETVLKMGFTLVSPISNGAHVSRSATIGQGTIVMPGAIINAGAAVGNGVIINTGATIDHDCILSDYCHVAPGVNLAGTVTLGVGSFLGVGTKVIDGISIGEWVVAGAGSVVVRDVPGYCQIIGVPARVTKKLK